MLHVKFQDHRLSGSEEILMLFTIYGHDGHVTKMVFTFNLCSLVPRRLHIKFGFNWQSGLKGTATLMISMFYTVCTKRNANHT